ncbi:MAG: isocitrate/isopropylmalate family dehydrogenase, partial [Candidatus Dormibacteraeota bacterium]|nr:isocitrate/isopropylmalate family dehydrogenase [Candidatus Dormibacteraeota bacterium]
MSARIVTLPGDGVGPEVTAQAVAVLIVVARRADFDVTFDERPIGGCAIDATGEPLPDDTLAACRAADAVLL